jgi:hypothetical protein
MSILDNLHNASLEQSKEGNVMLDFINHTLQIFLAHSLVSMIASVFNHKPKDMTYIRAFPPRRETEE